MLKQNEDDPLPMDHKIYEKLQIVHETTEQPVLHYQHLDVLYSKYRVFFFQPNALLLSNKLYNIIEYLSTTFY